MTDRMDTEALRALAALSGPLTTDRLLSQLAAEVLELRAKVQDLGTEGHAYREGKLAGHRIGFNAGIEAAAKIADDEAARILSKQDGREPMVDQNLRFMALMLPEVAIAIRALKQEASNG